MTNVLELRGIYKSYCSGNSKINILDDLEFSMPEGEICAILGQSGCGKTTLLQIIGLLDKPDSGKIVIKGDDFGQAEPRQRTLARRTKLGFIYQFHHLLPDFTALENLIIPQIILGKDEGEADKDANEMMSSLGLQGRVDHFPAQLSGGEQQRVAIARGIINQPDLLLADEPTGNLDPQNASMISNLLIKIVRSLNLSMLLVTHSMDLAKKADRIMLLQDGKLRQV